MEAGVGILSLPLTPAVVLLDTDVFSYLLKDDSRAGAYITLIQDFRLALSFMTVAELFQWARMHKWGSKRIAQLEQTLTTYILIPADLEMCRIWGAVRSAGQAAGQTIAPQDAWIAATALRYGLPLVTNNASDFKAVVGLELRTAPQP